MSDLSRRGARRRGNSKNGAITGGMIVGMTVYPWDDRCSKLVGINIVKISEADYRDSSGSNTFADIDCFFFIGKNFGRASAQDAPGRGGTWRRTGEGDGKKKAQTRTASTTPPRASHHRNRLQ